MNYLSQQEFLKLTSKGNLIPVYKEIPGDLETPVSAYYKLAGRSAYSFLLESVEGEEKVARYSFIARDPELVFTSKGHEARVLRFVGGRHQPEKISFEGSPLSVVRRLMKDYRAVQVDGLPRFYGGMVGYLSYDCVRFFERLPDKTVDDLKLPDVCLGLARDLVAFDHRHHAIKVISCVHLDKKDGRRAKIKKYNAACRTIDALIADLRKPYVAAAPKRRPKKISAVSNFTKAQYERVVSRAKVHIKAGDIFQIVPSQRFQMDINVGAFEIYRSLRVLNPSPYMFYLDFDGLQLVGASPELLVRCENGVVETRPIAGTRPRGGDEAQDEALKKSLLADPKEKAEHIMLVDLGRNDLGRVCEKGTVRLSEFMEVEKYSHVMHIVSNVRGMLRKDKDALDALEAVFPAGTLSGAPKIRAMEIIEDMEPQKRGPYGGCVGILSFSKNLDTCITIRTIVVHKKKAYVQAGGGVVADSDPATEYMETMNKARAQIKAIELAHA
ncbi:MAG: anthranilate synthase component I [Candidatus Omnitrophica bacterium]|nr:anthranilate synthase component I [Candidatus Omnitrophota bacterium]MDE2008826.1 anthranilate synthase component I [Candidatus Omnitrophota bacterium]MDE2213611.1 anthranilate synthase component I [Candidatus Omnitrophota bacterium]MDE2230488.1 anthranilate synthase component I [Candidatus Omnitrophota bacterium]